MKISILLLFWLFVPTKEPHFNRQKTGIQDQKIEIVVLGNKGIVDAKIGIPVSTGTLRIQGAVKEDSTLTIQKNVLVAKGSVSLVGSGVVREVSPFLNGNIDLRTIAAKVRNGDNLVIEVKEVKRKNEDGSIQVLNNYNRFIMLPYR